MRYTNEKFPAIEPRLEWFVGPMVMAIMTAIVCAILLSRAQGL